MNAVADIDRQDVERWTGWVRHDRRFAGLREAMKAHGFDPTELLVAYYAESEDSMEHGVILKPDGSAYWFHHSNEGLRPNIDTFESNQVKDTAGLMKEDPAIPAAFEMLKEKAVAGA